MKKLKTYGELSAALFKVLMTTDMDKHEIQGCISNFATQADFYYKVWLTKMARDVTTAQAAVVAGRGKK